MSNIFQEFSCCFSDLIWFFYGYWKYLISLELEQRVDWLFMSFFKQKCQKMYSSSFLNGKLGCFLFIYIILNVIFWGFWTVARTKRHWMTVPWPIPVFTKYFHWCKSLIENIFSRLINNENNHNQQAVFTCFPSLCEAKLTASCSFIFSECTRVRYQSFHFTLGKKKKMKSYTIAPLWIWYQGETSVTDSTICSDTVNVDLINWH